MVNETNLACVRKEKKRRINETFIFTDIDWKQNSQCYKNSIQYTIFVWTTQHTSLYAKNKPNFANLFILITLWPCFA